jgi:hypothetical protein
MQNKLEGFKKINSLIGVIILIGDLKLKREDLMTIFSLHGFTPYTMSKLIVEYNGFLFNNVTNIFKNCEIELKRLDTYKSYENVINFLIKIMEEDEHYELCKELLEFKSSLKNSFEECEERHRDWKELISIIS